MAESSTEVESKRVKRTLYFVRDDPAKQELIGTGTRPGDIYSLAELELLLRANRQKPFTDGELERLDEIKKLFSATVTEIARS